jgi:hypothetical protein
MFCLELGAHIMIASVIFLTTCFLILQIPFQQIEMARCVPLSMRRCSTSQFQYSDRHLLLKITGASTPGNANNTPPSELHQASSYSTSTRFPQNGSLHILQNNQR